MDAFARRLLSWFDEHGRHDLPWQHPRTPYRVWLSEIMLQQTQVRTVIDYFQRFVAAFPDVRSLADAEHDEVMALWAGLGYYARARNLHKAAQQVRDEHDGEFPSDLDALKALPGVGASTAAAIRAQAFDKPAAILDGNVKRVLSRYHLIEGWPGKRAVEKKLWAASESHTPDSRAADYTQAIMDLGATICRSKQPACLLCPQQNDCAARIQGCAEDLPTRAPRKKRPERETTFYLLYDEHENVLLEQRPQSGIWGGMWCLPETPPIAAEQFSIDPARLRHDFTHYRLHISLARASVSGSSPAVADRPQQWFALPDALASGIPKPVRSLLEHEHAIHQESST